MIFTGGNPFGPIGEFMAEILNFGSINVDFFADIQRIPLPGETLESKKFRMGFGGKGANQAVAASRLAATSNVEMIGRVGNDYFGQLLLENFRKNNITSSSISVGGEEHSGAAIILIDPKAENYILPIYGANLLLGKQEVQRASDCLKSAKVLMIQQEVPIEASLEVAKEASSLGVIVIHDPSPIKKNASVLFPYTTFILPNQIEAEGISGVKVVDLATAELATSKIKEAGANSVILKLGENGCYVDCEGIHGHFLAPKVNAVNTAGAGDVFAGALSVAISEGMDISDSIDFANNAAALSVTKDGIQESMPTRVELDRWRY